MIFTNISLYYFDINWKVTFTVVIITRGTIGYNKYKAIAEDRLT